MIDTDAEAGTARPEAWQVVSRGSGLLRVAAGLARFSRRKPLGAFGGLLIVVIVVAAVGANAFAPHDPNTIDAGNTLAGPSADHIMGTDQLGRDIFSAFFSGRAFRCR